jgi:phage shock protein C
MKRLYRSNKDVVIAGVCSGVAEYFGFDPVIVRILWAIMVIFGGTGLLAYIICAIIIPKRPVGDVDYEYVRDDRQKDPTDPGHKENNKGIDLGSDNARLAIGLGFIGLGALLFFRQIVPWFDFSLVWPVILILIGGLIVMKGRGE